MIEVYNNKLIVDSKDPLFDKLRLFLRYVDETSGSRKSEPEVKYLFRLNRKGQMEILPGLDMFIPSTEERVDKRVSTLPELRELNFEKLAVMSDKVTLRDDQIIAVRKMYYLKTGLLQLPTGIGKSEIMAGFLKCINEYIGYDLDTIILEPTIKLVNDTVKRFNNYGIKAKPYAKSRGKVEGIIITHPKSLINDLRKNPHLLDNVKIFLGDEIQHIKCDTWCSIIYNLPNVEYRLGLSALVIDEDKLPVDNIHKLDYTEIMAIGGIGDVLMHMKSSFYIQRGILSTPVLFRIENSANEPIRKYNNWTQIRKYRLESRARATKIANISSYLAVCGYKSLILVGTKAHAYEIMKLIGSLGLKDQCRCTFGGNQYFELDEHDNPVKCKDPKQVYSDFEKGDVKIFIGTSHIFEGADVPNLDAVILSGVGKHPRRVIQGIGRALRKTKTGKYAYIIDFTDHSDYILSKHSLDRLEYCKNLVGVSTDKIYSFISYEDFKLEFYRLEGLGGK